MKKLIIKFAFVIAIAAALSAVASASDTGESQPEALRIAAELMETGSCTCDYAGDASSAAAFKRDIQAYIDALSAESETPGFSMTLRGQTLVMKLKPVEHVNAAELDAGMASGKSVSDINAYLCNMLAYDGEAASDTAKQDLSYASFTAAGSLASGKAVCQGYANAFAMLAEANGFQVIKVRGYTKGTYHVANTVMTEDGLKIVDVTSNDSNGNTKALLISLEAYQQLTGFQSAIDIDAAFATKYAA